MKKLLLSLLVFGVFGLCANAQERADSNKLINKHGIRILPQVGDFAFGISANEILNFVGNMMNNSTDNSIRFTYPNFDNTVYGKYFLTDQKAIRAKIRIGLYSITKTNSVQNDNDNSQKVEDKLNRSATDITISAGIEKRRGFQRIQGIYGAEVTIGLSQSGYKYTYGNSMTSYNQSPTSTIDFYNRLSTQTASRTLEISQNLSFSIGFRGFIGVEYFFAPKISVTGEFGWGPQLVLNGKNVDESETWDWTLNQRRENKSENKGDKTFQTDNDNGTGIIALLFHF